VVTGRRKRLAELSEQQPTEPLLVNSVDDYAQFIKSNKMVMKRMRVGLVIRAFAEEDMSNCSVKGTYY
jgi:hypothetical protein